MKFRHKIALLTVALVTTLSASGQVGIINLSPGLLEYISSKWGTKGAQRALDLQLMEQQQAALPRATANNSIHERKWLSASSTFWNQVPYFSDKEHWGVDDYWATPIETVASNGGDCEDYSIGKYLTLKDLGIPIQKLRITYVRALKRNEAHMVLAYYPAPDAEPLILDNLTDKILPASQRTDLYPVYSFNDDDLWVEGGGSSKAGKSSQIRLWRDLLEKMAKEKKL